VCYTSGDIRISVLVHFTAAILRFWLPVWSGSYHNASIGLLDPENMGVAVEILLLAGLEPEIHLGGNSTPPLVMQRCKKTLDLLGLSFTWSWNMPVDNTSPPDLGLLYTHFAIFDSCSQSLFYQFFFYVAARTNIIQCRSDSSNKQNIIITKLKLVLMFVFRWAWS
jgi:hypothetical protein